MEFTLYRSGAVGSLVILPRPERIIMDIITVRPNGLLLYPNFCSHESSQCIYDDSIYTIVIYFFLHSTPSQ